MYCLISIADEKLKLNYHEIGCDPVALSQAIFFENAFVIISSLWFMLQDGV